MGGIFSCDVLKTKVHPQSDFNNHNNDVITTDKVEALPSTFNNRSSNTKVYPMGLTSSSTLKKGDTDAIDHLNVTNEPSIHLKSPEVVAVPPPLIDTNGEKIDGISNKDPQNPYNCDNEGSGQQYNSETNEDEDDVNDSYDYGDENALNAYLHSSMSSSSMSASIEQLKCQSRMILDNMDEQTSTMFDVTALSLDMDREDLLLNMLYFSNQDQQQQQLLLHDDDEDELNQYGNSSESEDYLRQSLSQSMERSLINQAMREYSDNGENLDNNSNDDDDEAADYNTSARDDSNNNTYVLYISQSSHLSSSTSSTTSPVASTTTVPRRNHVPTGTHPYPVMPVTFGQMFNGAMEETVAMHSQHNTPYALKPLTAAGVEKLLLKNSKEARNLNTSFNSPSFDNDRNSNVESVNNINTSGSNNHSCSICMDAIITPRTTDTAANVTTISSASDLKNDGSSTGLTNTSDNFATTAIATMIIRLPGCGHVFHSECLLKWVTLQDWCPECRTVIKLDNDY